MKCSIGGGKKCGKMINLKEYFTKKTIALEYIRWHISIFQQWHVQYDNCFLLYTARNFNLWYTENARHLWSWIYKTEHFIFQQWLLQCNNCFIYAVYISCTLFFLCIYVFSLYCVYVAYLVYFIFYVYMLFWDKISPFCCIKNNAIQICLVLL